jgi:hypothetical protein
MKPAEVGGWRLGSFIVAVVLLSAATFPFEARQMPAAPVYAIQGAKIVTGTTTIDKGNLVMRDGVIADVGANAPIPS